MILDIEELVKLTSIQAPCTSTLLVILQSCNALSDTKVMNARQTKGQVFMLAL